MNLILIGMRGSGKSTVGSILAQKMGRAFYDMDALVTQRAGITIAEIVRMHGWETFRDQEAAMIQEVAEQTKVIIAPGAGAILKKSSVEILAQHGTFIWLKASVEQLLKRLENDTCRPSLLGNKTCSEEMEEIWAQRKHLYAQTADIVVETDHKTPEEVALELLALEL